MPVSMLLNPERSNEFVELEHPEPEDLAPEPTSRVVLRQIGWELHLALDKALGDDRPGPRFYYLDGDLEIVSTSEEHERLKVWISSFLDDYLMTLEVQVVRRGQATMRILKKAGAEPDDAWILGEPRQWPNLVLEIALSSGGLPKLEIYRQFAVSEVWMWRRGGLEFYALRADASDYDRLPASRLLAKVPLPLIARCLEISDWREARMSFRRGLESI